MMYTTPWQTVGPFLHIGMAWLAVGSPAGEGVAGERIAIAGTLVDGLGAPIPDGLIEIWQANSHGRYDHPDDARGLPLEAGFRGFARVPADAQGGFALRTIKPGRVPDVGGRLQAPHIVVSVFARGILKRLCTRIYFPDEAANDEDPVLEQVPAERRSTLIASRQDEGSYRFNIVVQGEALGQGETVFFDI